MITTRRDYNFPHQRGYVRLPVPIQLTLVIRQHFSETRLELDQLMSEVAQSVSVTEKAPSSERFVLNPYPFIYCSFILTLCFSSQTPVESLNAHTATASQMYVSFKSISIRG